MILEYDKEYEIQCIYRVIFYICFFNTDKMNEVQTQTKRKCCRTNFANDIQSYFYLVFFKFEVLYFLR